MSTNLSGAQVPPAFGRSIDRRTRPHGASQATRPQTDRGQAMPTSLSPSPTRNDRRLVFTSSEAARYLGVSLATIRRWTDAGHLSGYRTPGGQRRFSRAQLDGFVESLHRTDETTPKRQGRNVA